MTSVRGHGSHEIEGLVRALAALTEKRSELLLAESRLWADATRVLSEVMRLTMTPVPSQTTKTATTDYDDRHLLSVEDAAAFLSLSRATLNKWRVHGGGPEFIRIGRRIFYRRATLDRFIAEKTYPHTSAYGR